MPSVSTVFVALSSTVVRLGAVTFLRWIPGHHFPPIIVGSLLVYLAFIALNSQAFEPQRVPVIEVSSASSNGTTDKANGHSEKDQDEKVLQRTQKGEAIFNEDEKSAMKILVSGVPNWRDKEFSFISIGINILLALFTLDLIFRGPLMHPNENLRFSRVGFVDSTSAKVLFREPDSSQLPVYAYYTPEGTSNWVTVDRIYYLDDDTDFTYPVVYAGLQPSTSYIYSLSNNLTGTFTTAPSKRSPASDHLTFLTSSCIKANFPYAPLSHSLSIPGFTHLSTLIQTLPTPASFMLFLGDFIYVDVPLRLSSTVSHYRAEYRRVYASPSWSLPGISSVPWINTLDDHEIANDWAGGNQTEPFPSASDPFIHYHVSVNPPIPPTTTAYPSTENITYFQFTHGPASFFMLDTRRYRTEPEGAKSIELTQTLNTHHPSNSTDHHTMLGAFQLASLLTYLASPEPSNIHWKIIASSVPFTKNWRFGTSDSWGGYLAERATVLAAMHAAEANLGIRVIVLSGDRHEFAAVRFPAPLPSDPTNETQYAEEGGPHEFSVGPLSMFYLPFRTFKQVNNEDVAIKYIPDGNSKIGSITIDNLEGGEQKSMLKYSLWVDGKVRWEYNLTSPELGYMRKPGLLGGILRWAGAGGGRNST